MRMLGAGGCFESRKYPKELLEIEKTWIYIKEIAYKIDPMKVDTIDDNAHIMKGSDKKTNLYTIFVRQDEHNDAEIEIGMDVAPSTIRVYGFSIITKPVDRFFEEIEAYVATVKANTKCSACGKFIPAQVRFCPECGAPQQ